MEIPNGVLSTTRKVWNILVASNRGDLNAVKEMAKDCRELLYAQYNYTPPIHFAVREGHADLVRYLLDQGAHDPEYRIYPFRDSLQTVARDREHHEIAGMLDKYAADPANIKFKGDNGRIIHQRTALQNEFQKVVNDINLSRTLEILKEHPEFALDENYFWGEGILMMPAKGNHREMIELLISYGAKVPLILKWTQKYYFERYDAAAFMLEKGMNPNVMSWHHVTILHDMAEKGNIPKVELLLKYGANLDLVEEEYQSTPLGLAARWGHIEMVEYLLGRGADPNKSGASWSTPLSWARKKGYGNIEELLRSSGAK